MNKRQLITSIFLGKTFESKRKRSNDYRCLLPIVTIPTSISLAPTCTIVYYNKIAIIERVLVAMIWCEIRIISVQKHANQFWFVLECTIQVNNHNLKRNRGKCQRPFKQMFSKVSNTFSPKNNDCQSSWIPFRSNLCTCLSIGYAFYSISNKDHHTDIKFQR